MNDCNFGVALLILSIGVWINTKIVKKDHFCGFDLMLCHSINIFVSFILILIKHLSRFYFPSLPLHSNKQPPSETCPPSLAFFS